MARADDFKARLSAFIAEQEASLADLENRYLDEKVRLINQIAAAKRALVGMDDPGVGVLINTLQEAGVTIKAGG